LILKTKPYLKTFLKVFTDDRGFLDKLIWERNLEPKLNNKKIKEKE